MNEKSDLLEAVYEATHRLTVASRMMRHHECSPQKDETGGFENSIACDVIDDVVATLREAADRAPVMKGGA